VGSASRGWAFRRRPDRSALGDMRIPASRAGLETAAVSAVQRLAGADGYSVAVRAADVVGGAHRVEAATVWIAFMLRRVWTFVACAASFRAPVARSREEVSDLARERAEPGSLG
jgi:hypothetical protein